MTRPNLRNGQMRSLQVRSLGSGGTGVPWHSHDTTIVIKTTMAFNRRISALTTQKLGDEGIRRGDERGFEAGVNRQRLGVRVTRRRHVENDVI